MKNWKKPIAAVLAGICCAAVPGEVNFQQTPPCTFTAATSFSSIDFSRIKSTFLGNSAGR